MDDATRVTVSAPVPAVTFVMTAAGPVPADAVPPASAPTADPAPADPLPAPVKGRSTPTVED